MRTVHKFDLAPGTNILTLPRYAQVLSVGWQGASVKLWALVEDAPGPETVQRTIVVTGTGQALPDDSTLHYFGRVEMHGGAIQLHVFEVIPA